jgi:hypothetical protein
MAEQTAPIPRQGDSNIPLPQRSPRLRLRGRLWSMLRRAGGSTGTASAKSAASDTGPQDIWGAFEYLVGEYEATGRLHVDLVDGLAATAGSQTGQARFDVQCNLAAALADRSAPRFHVALRLATRLPVPQARAALLAMLTEPDPALWRSAQRPVFAGHDGSQMGQHHRHDLRPAAIAALGQLRDPSLLGLFHRLLEKLSSRPAEHRDLIAAVQWSLMNLAPGGHGEPVPAAILSRRSAPGPDNAPEPGTTQPAAEAASTVEALRVVGAIPEPQPADGARAGQDGTGAAATDSRSGGAQDSASGAAERDELLSGF